MSNELAPGLVRILNTGGVTVGAGFVVSTDGLIATCAHVVRDAGGQPGGTVRIVLHASGQELVAAVEPAYWREPEAEDVAILRLEAPLPEQVQPLPLGHSAQAEGKTLKTFGFPDAAGRLGEAHVLGAFERNGIRILQLRSPEITVGYSGAPVWDDVTQCVVGMVDSVALPDAVGRGTETAFITPSETLVDVCPALQLQVVDERQQKLAEYRQWILEETRFVNLRGIPLPKDRSGRPVLLRVPLDKVYIRIQAVEYEQRRIEEEREEQAIEDTDNTRANDLENRSGEEREKQPIEDTGNARASNSENQSNDSLRDDKRRKSRNPLASIRALGEYLYRRGEVYQSSERPTPIDPEDALNEHGRIVILGAPGSGKSTLLRYLARHATQSPDSPVPILMSLRDFAASKSQNDALALQDFALAQASGNDKHLRAALEGAIADARVIWLLDALDEARGWAEDAARQASRLPGRLVVTSRPIGYPSTGLQSLKHFEVLPLSSHDVDQFFNDWFGIMADQRNAGSGWAQARQKWLKNQLDQQPRLQPLVQNPLLLTFLVILTTQNRPNTLPTHRSELYSRYIQELLASWEACRAPQHEPDGQVLLTIGHLSGDMAHQIALQGFYWLGWSLHLIYYGGQSDKKPTRGCLMPGLSQYLRSKGNEDTEILAKAVLDFWTEAGLLDHWQLESEEYLAFRHLTFQEYAAAWQVARVWREDARQAWAFLRPRLHHYAWREPLLLLAGILSDKDRSDLVRRLLGASSLYEGVLHRDLRLAGMLLGEGGQLGSKSSGHVISRLGLLAIASHEWAITLLGQIGDERVVCYLVMALWNADENPRAAVTNALARIGTQAVPCLSKALLVPYAQFRRGVVEALGQIKGEQAVPVLIRALRDRDTDVQLKAAETLGEIGSKETIPHLVRLLHADGWEMVTTAAKALGRLKSAEAVPHLIEILERAEPELGEAAGEALGQIGDSRSVWALILALEGSDTDIRRAAIRALGQIGGVQAVPRLIQMLTEFHSVFYETTKEALAKIGVPAVPDLVRETQNPDARVRQAVVDVLGQIGDQATVPSLILALGDSDVEVRQAATTALRRIGIPTISDIINALQDSEYYSQRVTAVIAGIGSQTPLDIVSALRSPEAIVRFAAIVVLGRTGDIRFVPDFIQVLQDEDRRVRSAAAWALGQVQDSRATLELGKALHDEDEDVRVAAAEALGQIGDVRGVPHLVCALQEWDKSVLHVPGRALQQIGAAAVPDLVRALPNPDPDIRHELARLLYLVKDVRAVPYLALAVRDSQDRVRQAGITALEQMIREQPQKPESVPDQDKPQQLRERIYARITPVLIQALRYPQRTVRAIAAEALGRMAAADAVPDLILLLQDSFSGAYLGAIRALGRIGDVRAVPYLLVAMQISDPSVRKLAQEVLGQIGNTEAIHKATKNTEEAETPVRRLMLKALDRTREAYLENSQFSRPHQATSCIFEWSDVAQMTDELIHALCDTDFEVRWAAAEALGQMGNTQAIPHLIQTLQEDSWANVKAAAASALMQMGVKVVPDFIQALKNPSARVRRIAATALGHTRDERAVPSLIKALRDSDTKVRQAAAEALGEIGDIRAVPQLLQALKGQGPEIWDDAAHALELLVRKIDDRMLVSQIAQALWRRRTIGDEFMLDALEQVANHLAALEAESLPAMDLVKAD